MKETKIIISDYDDTIIKNTGKCFDDVCTAILGEDGYEQMKDSSYKYGGLDYFSAFIKQNSLTKEKTCEMWTNFKKTDIYKELKNANNKTIDKALISGENIPEKNVTEYFINNVLYTLITMYSIYIKHNVPNDEFFTLYEKTKENNDIFIINTMKNQKLIEMELKEYTKINKEKYKAFDELLSNHRVIGSMKETFKRDNNRIEKLLHLANVKLNENSSVFVIGDSLDDFVNFEEVVKFNIKSQFLFVETRLCDEIKELKTCLQKVNNDIEKYQAHMNKLAKCEKELNAISIKSIKYKNNTKNNSYGKLATEIYSMI